MYTVKELEHIVSEGSNAVDITDIVDQLLDALKRIDAAAAIPARSMQDASDVEDIIAAGGANQMRVQFRKALGL